MAGIIPLNLDMLPDFFDPVYYNRGLSYYRSSMVRSVRLLNGGRKLLSRVMGSGSRLYSCEIDLVIRDGEVTAINGACSCPVGYNCKHVVASLVQQLTQQRLMPGHEGRLADLIVKQWLDSLDALDRQRPRRTPEQHHLRFILDLQEGDHGRVVRVAPYKTYRLKSNRWAKGTLFTAGSHSQAGFLTPLDRELLRLLESFQRGQGRPREGYFLVESTSAHLLERLLESERTHWQTLDNPVLILGTPLSCKLGWQLDEEGLLRPRIAEAPRPDLVLLPMTPPWYLDPEPARAGLLETGLDPQVAALVASAPPIPVHHASLVSQRLAKAVPGHNLQLPQVRIEEAREDVAPVPCLTLRAEKRVFHYFGTPEDQWDAYALLQFEYLGKRVHPDDPAEVLTLMDSGGDLVRFRRRLEEESEQTERLWDFGLTPVAHAGVTEKALRFEHELKEEGWIEFSLVHLPLLEEEGWQIQVDPSFPWRVVEPEGWYADLDEEDGGDWFDLELGVCIEGEKISLLPLLVRYLAEQKNVGSLKEFLEAEDELPLLVSLPDEKGRERILSLPFGKVRSIVQALVELYDPESLDAKGRLRMSRYHAAELDGLAQAGLTWGGNDAPRKFAEKLAEFRQLETVPPPKGLKTELRPYQQYGLDWLQFLRKYDLSGILADDMGLGKTVQALAHLLVEKESGRAEHPSLVVATTSLMVNWASEAARFAPSLKVLVLHGPQRKEYFDRLAEYDLVLTTYPLLPRDSEVLLKQRWHLVILDEAHHVKNPRTKVARTACRLQANHRLCLTGTPMENHLGELWSQFNFLMPGLLGDERRFRALFRNPIERQGDRLRQELLNRRIAPFMLRREKSEVAAELPQKTEIPVLVELEGKQRQLYETIRVAMDERVRREIDRKGVERSQIVILDALLKLRQVCCDPRLLKMEAAKGVTHSAKLAQLMEMVPELIDEGRRILLFSQFTSMLALIEAELKKKGICYVKLTGSTRDRATPVEQFQAGEVPLFLVSLKAGGAGLNLTAADTVIHYDPWWNPAVERQATDRAHRIGQENPVFVYRLVASGTVEEKINELQRRKQALADALFDGSGKGGRLSREDLQALFEPLE